MVDFKALRERSEARRERKRLEASNAELLEALEFYRDQWDWGPGNESIRHMIPSGELLDDRGERARAIIAKAKGEQP